MKTPEKIFIDCGANRGQGLLHFDEQLGGILGNPLWKVYSFEPNPFCSLTFIKDAKGTDSFDNLTFEHKAVWTHSGEIPLYGVDANYKDSDPHKYSEAAFLGIETEHGKEFWEYNGGHPELAQDIEGYSPPGTPMKAQALDFPKFLTSLRNTLPAASVYIKMDIEHSEYPVLDALLAQPSSLSMVKKMWIEFHSTRDNAEDRDVGPAVNTHRVKDLLKGLKALDIDAKCWG